MISRRLAAVVVCASACASREPAPRPVAPAPTPRATPPAPAPPPAPPAAPSVPPAIPSGGFLKGQTHVHSARSYDGHTPPEQVLAFYARRGYDFVALTDHNRVTVVEPPKGLLLVPGIELSQNSTVCEPKPAPGYRCLFHMSGLFVDPARDTAHGESIPLPFRPGRLDAYTEELDVVDSLGGVSVLNHPLFHFAADAHMVETLAQRGVKLIELVNASLDQQHPSSRAVAERHAEELWDEVLSSGTRVFALATDDAHHFADAADRAKAGKFAYVGDRAWIMVRSAKQPAAIREAMLAGHFYASTGVGLDALEASEHGIELTVHAPAGGSYVTRFIGRHGKELARGEGLHASYAARGDEGYVRAVVEDGAGHKAWVQPVFPSSGP